MIAPGDARILAVANQKGGVGKTTTAVNLGTALAAIGERVMILDLDPQGNASTGLGFQQADRIHSSRDVLAGEIPIAQAYVETFVPNLSLVPSTLDLLGFEIELANRPDRAFCLRDSLRQFTRSEAQSVHPPSCRHSYFILDCPPSLNLITVNALAAAHAVIIPMQCEFLALEGLGQILRVVQEVQNGTNPQLDVQGIVLTMYDRRNRLSDQVVADVREIMGDKVYKTVIPRNVRISEAPSYGKPVLLYDYKCSGSVAYLKLASEVIQRERARRAS